MCSDGSKLDFSPFFSFFFPPWPLLVVLGFPDRTIKPQESVACLLVGFFPSRTLKHIDICGVCQMLVYTNSLHFTTFSNILYIKWERKTKQKQTHRVIPFCLQAVSMAVSPDHSVIPVSALLLNVPPPPPPTPTSAWSAGGEGGIFVFSPDHSVIPVSVLLFDYVWSAGERGWQFFSLSRSLCHSSVSIVIPFHLLCRWVMAAASRSRRGLTQRWSWPTTATAASSTTWCGRCCSRGHHH